MSDVRKDYGPKGCCGPTAAAVAVTLIGLLSWVIAAVVS